MARSSSQQRWLGITLILALAALAVFRSHLGTRLDGYTVDEPWHIVAGVSYLRTGDFRLNPEHPPLVKLVAGAAMPDDFSLRPLAPLVEKTQERELVEETLYFDNDSAAAQQDARRGLWLFHALLLVLLGGVLWQAFGLAWSLGTLAFLALEPSIGAHLPVVMTDLPLALCFGLAVGCAGLLASRWQWRWALACGVAVGLCLGAKHSALAGIAGIAGVLAVATFFGLGEQRRVAFARRWGQLGIAALLAWVVLWGQYGFRFHAGPDGSDAFNRPMPDKIADLNIPHWREGIAFADRHHLLPRAYLWGLADTVRAGIEGRGQSSHWLWGVKYKGKAPWFTWPSFVLAKVPLALTALSLLGLLLLPTTRLEAPARWTLAVLLGGSAAHLLALMGSQGTYGGIRHALPLVVALAILAGAAVASAWQRRARFAGVAMAVLFLAAFGMTLREPRLWEYHNELAGGTANAYTQFGNEGLDLGQRFPEMRAFHDRVIVPEQSTLFVDYWFGEKQAIAAKMRYRRRILGMEDDNVAGVYEGYFMLDIGRTLPEPDWGWDPDTIYKDTKVVTRLGHVQVRKGRVEDPMGRAGSMYYAVVEYLYRKSGKDDVLITRRLEEVVKVIPAHVGAAVELANAYQRLGDGPSAVRALRRLLDHEKVPVEALVRTQVEAQLAKLESSSDPASLEPLRNPWME